jgi:hypothetical protein
MSATRVKVPGRRVAATAGALGIVLAAWAGEGGGGEVGGGEEAAVVEEVLTPIVASVSTEPRPVTGTDGRMHLAYELLLINATTTEATIDSVQAVGGETDEVLEEYAGDDLLSHARVVGEQDTGTTVELRGGQAAFVWLDVTVDDREALPDVLRHEIAVTFAEAPNPLLPAQLTETVAQTPVSDTPAPVIASPLDGSNWLTGNGCCAEVSPHRGAANPINGRYFFAERFAIDWVQLDEDMQIFDGEPTEMSSYAYYDAPVHAVADGTIVAVVDHLQDQPPGSNPAPGTLQVTEFGGNHVVQLFEQNGHTYYAFYAHLAPGSASEYVEVGQEVDAGDQVGRLGNSGNTDSPHLHFHVMDSPNPLASNGLPFVLESQELVGTAAGDDALGAALQGEPLQLTPAGPSGEREDQMPLMLDVTDLRPAT